MEATSRAQTSKKLYARISLALARHWPNAITHVAQNALRVDPTHYLEFLAAPTRHFLFFANIKKNILMNFNFKKISFLI